MHVPRGGGVIGYMCTCVCMLTTFVSEGSRTGIYVHVDVHVVAAVHKAA